MNVLPVVINPVARGGRRGPPTEHSPDKTSKAGFRRLTVQFHDGRIERAYGEGWKESFALLSDTEIQGRQVSPPGFHPPNHEMFVRMRRVE